MRKFDVALMVDSSGSIMDDYYWKLETEGAEVAEQYRNWPKVQDFLVQLADVFTIDDTNNYTRVSCLLKNSTQSNS